MCYHYKQLKQKIMKNLLYLLCLFTVFSCSMDEVLLEKDLELHTLEEKTKNNSILTIANSPCTTPSAINEYFVSSSIPYSIDINWNNFFLMLDCKSMEGKIEIFADGVTNPNTNLPQDDYNAMHCYGNISTPINAFVPIDFFNTTTYTLRIPDFGTKCLWWRIVFEGKNCGSLNSSCITTTSWHFVSTYDL